MADVILTGGLVWDGTGNETGEATAVAVSGGKVLAVGTDAEIEAHAGRGTKRIELNGRWVCNGSAVYALGTLYRDAGGKSESAPE